MFKKLSLELGGKALTLFCGLRFCRYVEHNIAFVFANQGQICLCGSRIFIERSIYDKFKDSLLKKFRG